jgi:hypothetical protein
VPLLPIEPDVEPDEWLLPELLSGAVADVLALVPVVAAELSPPPMVSQAARPPAMAITMRLVIAVVRIIWSSFSLVRVPA